MPQMLCGITGMVKDAQEVIVVVRRLACHGSIDKYQKINESIEAKICHDHSFGDEGFHWRYGVVCTVVN